MAADRHHREAGRVLARVLGADAAERGQAYLESLAQIARALELADRYKQLLVDPTMPVLAAPGNKAA